MARDSTCGDKTLQKKLGSRRNGPNRAKLPIFSATGRNPKRPKFNGCLMIQVSFWRSNFISCERVAPDACKSQFYVSFWRSNHFVRQGCAGSVQIAILTRVFGDRTSFRSKGLRRTRANRNFTTVFSDRTSLRAKGLRFVPSGWHCPAP